MNKKFVALSAMLLLGGGGSLFLTSCQKDYDGQIEILRNQIKSGVVDLNELKAKLVLIQEQIVKLEDALKQSDEANKAEIQKLINDLKAVKEDLAAQTARLQAQVDEAKTDINTLKGLVQTMEQTFNNKMLELSDRINGVDASLNVLDGRVAKLEEQVKAILEKQVLVDQTIKNLQKEIEDLKARPQTPDLTDKVNKLEEALEQMKLVDANLEQRADSLEALIKQVKNAAEQKDAQLEALIQKAAQDIANVQSELDAQIQKLTSKMTGLSDAMAALSSSVDALNQKYNVLDIKVNALQNEFKAQIDRIWEAINKDEAAGAEELALLKKSVAELQGALNNLNLEVKKGMAEVLERQELFGQSLESINQTLEKYKGDLSEISKQLDGLNVRVTDLEKWAKDFETAYGATIKDINDKIAALEKEQGGGGSVDLTAIKEQLKAMEDKLNAQTAELDKVKGNQTEMAKKLTDLQTEMRSSLLAIQVNYTVVLQRLGKAEAEIARLGDFTNTLQANIDKLNKDLSALTAEVSKNTADIVTLKAELAKLQGAQDSFLTEEEVKEMLKAYQDQVDATMEDFLTKLGQKPNRDEVEQMIADASKALEGQLAAMKTQISDLQNKVDALTQRVTSLENWAQSFETAYTTTMKVINDRIASLENKEGANADEIAALKTQLQQMQAALQAQADELDKVKGDQAKYADALTKFKSEMDAELLAIESNFAAVLDRMGVAEAEIKKLSDFAGECRIELGKLNTDLAALTNKVGKHADDIVWLKNEVARLEGQQKQFITKEDVQNMLKDYQQEVDKTFKDVFEKLNEKADRDEVKTLINDASQKLENQIAAMKTQIKDLKTQVDELVQKVNHLENWATAFEKAYDVTIKEIKAQIASLEQKQGDTSAEMETLKTQLKDMEATLADHTNQLNGLKDKQDEFAAALLKLRTEMTNKLLTLEKNLNAELEKVNQKVVDLSGKFTTELARVDAELGDLNNKIIAQEKKIVDLQTELNKLKNQHESFVTEAEVKAMLNEYQQKVNAKLTELTNQLNQKPSKEEMNKLIADTKQELQEQIADMQTEMDNLEAEVKDLKDQLAALVNRVQSMQLIPEYSNGAVKMTKAPNGQSVLALQVKVNPSTCITEIVKNKNFIQIECVDVIPVRSARIAPTFTVESLKDLGGGVMEVKATSSYAVQDDDTDKNMEFQVAVSLSDGNNDRTTNYANVRFSATPEKDVDGVYGFYFQSGNEVNTASSIDVEGLLKIAYPMDVLTSQSVEDYMVYQLPKGSTPFVANKITSSPINDRSKVYDVKYALAMILNKDNDPDYNLPNYVGVTPDGQIYMRANLNPAVTGVSLEDCKIVVSIQASDSKNVYGKKRYACVELKLKK